MKSIKEVLMERDGMSEMDAEDLIAQATTDLEERLGEGEMPFNICKEWFGLESDYMMEILPL